MLLNGPQKPAAMLSNIQIITAGLCNLKKCYMNGKSVFGSESLTITYLPTILSVTLTYFLFQTTYSQVYGEIARLILLVKQQKIP